MDAAPGRFTITISRQLGSLGHKVAEGVAQQLNYRLMWREIINTAALQVGAPEAALAAIDDLGLLGICPSPEACLAYRQAVEQVMRSLAVQGSVVVIGRAGQMILANQPNVLHVRLMAPLAVRIQRVSYQQQIDPQCALAQIKASDQNRKKYLKRFYNVRWDDPELYDLVINTARVPVQEAVRIICAALPIQENSPRSTQFISGK